jgi:hypothetical protein
LYVHLEVLADDKLDLPETIPSRKTHAGTARSTDAKTKQTGREG